MHRVQGSLGSLLLAGIGNLTSLRNSEQYYLPFYLRTSTRNGLKYFFFFLMRTYYISLSPKEVEKFPFKKSKQILLSAENSPKIPKGFVYNENIYY